MKRQATLFQSWGFSAEKQAGESSSSQHQSQARSSNVQQEAKKAKWSDGVNDGAGPSTGKALDDNGMDSDEEMLLAMELSLKQYEAEQRGKGQQVDEQPSTSGFLAPVPVGPLPTGTPLEDLPGFDVATGHTWIYPTNYPIREYQFDIVKAALFKNTLVTLPTGLGKTFIAAVLIYNFYRWYPESKVVFLAPTKPLVAQQIEACYQIMAIPLDHTMELTGSMNPKERIEAWKQKRVFFLTPQIIMNDLCRGTCPASDIKCVIFDEAHKATGNHAYCQVIKNLMLQTNQFRVLALSATPGSDMIAVRQVIENLLIAHVELRYEESLDILPYTHKREIEKVIVPLGADMERLQDKYMKIIGVFASRLINLRVLYQGDLKSLSQYQILLARDRFIQNPPPHVPRSSFGAIQGDFAACITLYHAYELLQFQSVKSFYDCLREKLQKENGWFYKELARNADMRELLQELEQRYPNDSSTESFARPGVSQIEAQEHPLPIGHPKMEKLHEIVLEHFVRHAAEGTTTRVMIFCQYRNTVQEITSLLQQSKPLIKAMSFIGHSTANKRGFSQKEQMQVVQAFKKGGYNTLVSTCIGEEGLDIGEVDLIICYDSHKSPIRLVQRMGRTGRQRKGRIVMVITAGKEEQKFNQSVYQKNSISKQISGNKIQTWLYHNNPRMVPRGMNPACHKMRMTVVEAYENAKFRTKKKPGRKPKADLPTGIDVAPKEKISRGKRGQTSKNLGYLTPAENAELQLKFALGPNEDASFSLPDLQKVWTLGLNESGSLKKELKNAKKNFASVPCTASQLKDKFIVPLSQRSQRFLKELNFAELMEVSEDSARYYENEMTTYLCMYDDKQDNEQQTEEAGKRESPGISAKKNMKKTNKSTEYVGKTSKTSAEKKTKGKLTGRVLYPVLLDDDDDFVQDKKTSQCTVLHEKTSPPLKIQSEVNSGTTVDLSMPEISSERSSESILSAMFYMAVRNENDFHEEPIRWWLNFPTIDFEERFCPEILEDEDYQEIVSGNPEQVIAEFTEAEEALYFKRKTEDHMSPNLVHFETPPKVKLTESIVFKTPSPVCFKKLMSSTPKVQTDPLHHNHPKEILKESPVASTSRITLPAESKRVPLSDININLEEELFEDESPFLESGLQEKAMRNVSFLNPCKSKGEQNRSSKNATDSMYTITQLLDMIPEKGKSSTVSWNPIVSCTQNETAADKAQDKPAINSYPSASSQSKRKLEATFDLMGDFFNMEGEPQEKVVSQGFEASSLKNGSPVKTHTIEFNSLKVHINPIKSTLQMKNTETNDLNSSTDSVFGHKGDEPRSSPRLNDSHSPIIRPVCPKGKKILDSSPDESEANVSAPKNKSSSEKSSTSFESSRNDAIECITLDDDDDDEDDNLKISTKKKKVIEPWGRKRKKERVPKRRKKRKVDFIQSQADVTAENGGLLSADDSDGSSLSSYDGSFISDGSQEESENVQALYLRAHCSPRLKNLRRNREEISPNDVFSQPVLDRSADYEQDSFCAGNDEVEYETNGPDTIILEEAERKLAKKTHKAENTRKRRRIKFLSSSEDESENNVPGKGNASELHGNGSTPVRTEEPPSSVPPFALKSIAKSSKPSAVVVPLQSNEISFLVQRSDSGTQKSLVMDKTKDEDSHTGVPDQICKGAPNLDVPPVQIISRTSSSVSDDDDVVVLSSDDELQSYKAADDSSVIFNRISPGEIVIMADSRQVVSAPDVIAALQHTYKVKLHLTSSIGQIYVISTRMGVARKLVSELGKPALKKKFVTYMRHLGSWFDVPYLILEKDRTNCKLKKPSWKPRNKFLDMSLVALTQTRIQVLHSNSQKETAELLWMLTKIEHKKNYSIPSSVLTPPDILSQMQFFIGYPHVTCSLAFKILRAFSGIGKFLNSSQEELQNLLGLSEEKARDLLYYINVSTSSGYKIMQNLKQKDIDALYDL